MNLHCDPKKYPKLKKFHKVFDDFLRGLIVSTIEVYFKSTHVFRTTEFMTENQDITAQDFVKFVNFFKLENIFSANDGPSCSKLGCSQIMQYDQKKMTKVKL